MLISARRPVFVESASSTTPCASCEARSISVCSAIDDADLARLAAMATVVELAPGETFIAEGEDPKYFYNVTAGAARLFKLLPDGRRQITGFAEPGHFLGLAAAGAYGFSAEAINRMRMCRFRRSKFAKLLCDFPGLEHRLLAAAGAELAAAQEQMMLLGRKTAEERAASFLLARSDQNALCGGSASRFFLPMTRAEIGDYLGLTLESVSRLFNKFKSEQIIALPSPAEVVVLDRNKLEARSGGLP
jgi:CRP/FNR family transcriptional regulator